MHTTETPRKIDVFEHGMDAEGNPSSSERRLFMQLQVYSGCRNLEEVAARIEESGLDAVVYQDLNHPQGCGLLTMDEDPRNFRNRGSRTAQPGALQLADAATRVHHVGSELCQWL